MGDEDEDQPESDAIWLNYFLRPSVTATEVISTEKANGEAAHLSARFIGNTLYSDFQNLISKIPSKHIYFKFRNLLNVLKFLCFGGILDSQFCRSLQ